VAATLSATRIRRALWPRKKASRFRVSAGNTKKPPRRLMGYAIAAKRYALYTQTKGNISVVKASGYGLGFLFAPKKIQSDEKSEHESNEDVPQWVVEAWD